MSEKTLTLRSGTVVCHPKCPFFRIDKKVANHVTCLKHQSALSPCNGHHKALCTEPEKP